MTKRLKKRSTVLFGLLAFSALLVSTVQAEKKPEIQIPIAITAEGTLPRKAEEYTVQITADNENNPMPNAQAGGIFNLVLNGVGEAVFPPIRFDALGVYTYTITQLAGDYPDCKYDKRTYTMRVSVTESINGGQDIAVLLHEIGNETKPIAAEFHNVYKTSTLPHLPPKTGADSRMLLWTVLLLLSGTGMVGAALIGRNKKEDYGK